MAGAGMSIETTGGFRAMQGVGLTASLTDKLTMLRSMEPEFQAWRAEQERQRQWVHEKVS